MIDRLKKIKKFFLHTFIGIYKVNWDTWSDCYDYGADKAYFLKKSLCSCRHRDYSHRITNYKIPLTVKDLDRVMGCVDCPCKEFKTMNNLDWLEYSNERVPQIKEVSSKDYYDYFTAVSKGEKIKEK